MYKQAIDKFEGGHKDQWRWYDVEHLGPDWGERGVFRKELRLVLYGGD